MGLAICRERPFCGANRDKNAHLMIEQRGLPPDAPCFHSMVLP